MSEWYSYKGITFGKYMMPWLLKHLELLKVGIWPDNPDKPESGYDTELPRDKKSRQYGEAEFVKPCSIAGEVEIRLAQLPFKERTLLLTRYSEEYRDEDCSRLAYILKMDVEELEEKIDKSLDKISGWSRPDKEE